MVPSEPDLEPDDDWRRYSVEPRPRGSGYALASAIVGVIGVLSGVNIWTIGLMFFGGIDIFLAPVLGIAALSLAAEAPSIPGSRLRAVGFVTGAIGLAIGIGTFVGFGF